MGVEKNCYAIEIFFGSHDPVGLDEASGVGRPKMIDSVVSPRLNAFDISPGV